MQRKVSAAAPMRAICARPGPENHPVHTCSCNHTRVGHEAVYSQPLHTCAPQHPPRLCSRQRLSALTQGVLPKQGQDCSDEGSPEAWLWVRQAVCCSYYARHLAYGPTPLHSARPWLSPHMADSQAEPHTAG